MATWSLDSVDLRVVARRSLTETERATVPGTHVYQSGAGTITNGTSCIGTITSGTGASHGGMLSRADRRISDRCPWLARPRECDRDADAFALDGSRDLGCAQSPVGIADSAFCFIAFSTAVRPGDWWRLSSAIL